MFKQDYKRALKVAADALDDCADQGVKRLKIEIPASWGVPKGLRQMVDIRHVTEKLHEFSE